MKALIVALKWTVSLVIFGHLVFWFTLNASGHKVPEKTDNTIIAVSSVLVVVLIVLFIAEKRIRKMKN